MNDIFMNCSPIFEQIFFPNNVHKIQCVSLIQNTKGGDDINGKVAFKVELSGIGEKIVETFGTSQIHFKNAKIFKFLFEFGVFCADPNPLLTLSEDFNSQRKFHCLSTAQTTTTNFAIQNKMAENELVLSSDDDNSQHSSSKEEKETSNVIMDAEEEYARAAPGTSNSNKRKATKRGNKDGAPKEKKAKKSKKATNFAELAKNAGDDTGLEEMKKILKGELDAGKLTKAKKANKKATKKEEEKMPAKSKEKKKAAKKVAAKESSEDSDSTSEWDSDEDKEEDSSDDEKEEEDSSDESGEIVKEEEEEEEESDELLARAKQHVKKDQGIYGDLLKPTIAHCLTFGQCKGCATYQKEKMLEPIVNRPIVGRVAQLVQCRECLRANTNMIGIGQQFFGQNDDLKEHTGNDWVQKPKLAQNPQNSILANNLTAQYYCQSYFDLSKCYILLELRIRKEDAAGNLVNLDPALDHVAPCQMIGHTIWKNCRMSINGSQVFEGNSLMAYKSWFDYMLTYPLHVKNAYLNAAGYYDDEELSQVTGRGLNARYQLFAGSRTAQFIAKLDLDICNQPRYIVNQCEIDIELELNNSNFLLIAEQVAGAPPLPHYQLEVLACKMYVKKVELMDSLAFDINKKLEISPARYPMRKSSMRAIFISENRTEFNGSLWADQVPKRIVLGMVTNSHYVGTHTSSPFDFRHFNVRDITISASGVLTPAAPYNFDFPNWKFARAYHDMQDACGFAGTLESNGISMNRYANGGCCVFVFNLTNSGEDNGPETFDLIRNGATTIKITFNQPVPAGGIVLIAMGEHESMLYLDRNRTVATDIQV